MFYNILKYYHLTMESLLELRLAKERHDLQSLPYFSVSVSTDMQKVADVLSKELSPTIRDKIVGRYKEVHTDLSDREIRIWALEMELDGMRYSS